MMYYDKLCLFAAQIEWAVLLVQPQVYEESLSLATSLYIYFLLKSPICIVLSLHTASSISSRLLRNVEISSSFSVQ